MCAMEINKPRKLVNTIHHMFWSPSSKVYISDSLYTQIYTELSTLHASKKTTTIYRDHKLRIHSHNLLISEHVLLIHALVLVKSWSHLINSFPQVYLPETSEEINKTWPWCIVFFTRMSCARLCKPIQTQEHS